jgi:hypothetical protein
MQTLTPDETQQDGDPSVKSKGIERIKRQVERDAPFHVQLATFHYQITCPSAL